MLAMLRRLSPHLLRPSSAGPAEVTDEIYSSPLKGRPSPRPPGYGMDFATAIEFLHRIPVRLLLPVESLIAEADSFVQVRAGWRHTSRENEPMNPRVSNVH